MLTADRKSQNDCGGEKAAELKTLHQYYIMRTDLVGLVVLLGSSVISWVVADDDGVAEGSGEAAVLDAAVFDKCAPVNQTERICGAAGSGVFFPVNPASEAEWPKVS